MVVCSVKEIVEDISSNGELTEQDVIFLYDWIGSDIDIDVIVELLSIPQILDWKYIHPTFGELLGDCLKRLYASDGILDNYSAKELINLFDPDDLLSPFEQKALQQLKEFDHSTEFQNFLDDRMII